MQEPYYIGQTVVVGSAGNKIVLSLITSQILGPFFFSLAFGPGLFGGWGGWVGVRC